MARASLLFVLLVACGPVPPDVAPGRYRVVVGVAHSARLTGEAMCHDSDRVRAGGCLYHQIATSADPVMVLDEPMQGTQEGWRCEGTTGDPVATLEVIADCEPRP